MIGAIVLQVILIICQGVFSAAEAAALDLSDAKLEELMRTGNSKALGLHRLEESPTRFLTTMRFLTGFCGWLGSACAALSFRDLVCSAAVKLLPGLSNAAAQIISVIVIVLIFSCVSLIIGYIVPRRLAVKNAQKTALASYGIISLLYKFFFPLIWFIIAVSRLILRLLGIDPNEREEVTEEEIRLMAESGSQMGAIDSQENEFIQNIFEFNDVTVDEVCTHRKDAVCVYTDDDKAEWDRVVYENKHSFYPVCGENTDDVVGVLDARDYLRMKNPSMSEIMENCVNKPYFVPESMKASVLFGEMKENGNYFAVAIDEYGGMAGIVTMRDLIELIVGEWNEKDEEPKPDDIQKKGEDSWLILGGTSLDDVAKELDVKLPVDEFDTFGGYVFDCLGYVPEDGKKELKVETEELVICIRSVEDHRIEETFVEKKKLESLKEQDTIDIS